ncbi:methyltransferase domain-containing protein [Radiobacillus kanasensis]|uniref:class I SAM-dependent methyltransferase n=1 Tax=Radiobacillus kanasensis TaxID=2844358 RepID=UPI001E57E920|nr:class I SAM-dependent methyltransferase [Radiobacillus kanasensis]UFT99776.1 methyltransferase domain-containing protein [Radiobacillus kanasensis]
MPINFHSDKVKHSYTTRKADSSWKEILTENIDFHPIHLAADIGCGGGIYSKALTELGVSHVIGIDFSEAILDGAREACKDYSSIQFQYGSAVDTHLKDSCVDAILERALIHHINDLVPTFAEAHRVLKDDGVYIVQDRTPEDCLLPGSEEHIRGYFFDLFPHLGAIEKKRRHASEKVIHTLEEVGFTSIKAIPLWETRKEYSGKQILLEDLQSRTGRSILHDLTDEQLQTLVKHIDLQLPEGTITEKDRWTIWLAEK